jgi:hypothetical protein
MSSTDKKPLGLLKTVETIQTTIKDLQTKLENKENINLIKSQLNDIKKIDEILQKIIIKWEFKNNQWTSPGKNLTSSKPKFFI